MALTDKPQVIIFTDWYLPGYKAGGPITSIASLVQHVGKRVDFLIVCRDRDYLSQSAYANIRVNAWNKVGHAQVLYLDRAHQTRKIYREILQSRPWCSLYINGIFSRKFSIMPLLAAQRLRREIRLAPRGMLAEGALSIKAHKKLLFLAVANRLGYYREVVFHATKKEEKEEILQRLSLKAEVRILPNLPAQQTQNKGGSSKKRKFLRLINIARIAKEKNTLYALECLKKVPADCGVRATFIGTVYDEVYYKQCLVAAAALPTHVTVHFEGAKPPSDLAPFLAEADLFFLPTLGENYGHAIIEALLSGLPVLISDATPWQNLQQKHLGADFPLKHQKAFVDFLCSIAEMDASEYEFAFQHVAVEAARQIDLDSLKVAYEAFFR